MYSNAWFPSGGPVWGGSGAEISTGASRDWGLVLQVCSFSPFPVYVLSLLSFPPSLLPPVHLPYVSPASFLFLLSCHAFPAILDSLFATVSQSKALFWKLFSVSNGGETETDSAYQHMYTWQREVLSA